MGFWDFLEDGTVLGKCETNYFHIYIYRDLPDADIFDYEDAIKGTFMHEYLHYIQFVSTVFGISYGIVYNNYFSYCVEHFSISDQIEIPLDILHKEVVLDDLVKRYFKLKGDKICSLEIDKIVVELTDIDSARSESISIKVKGLNSENGESGEFQFGYLGIVENMAIIFHSFFDKSLLNHPVVPYHTVEIMLNSRSKPITDKKLIFSICLCSLMFQNPVVGLFDVLYILEANPDYNGIKLYKHILGSTISHPNASNISELFHSFIDAYQANIETAICGKLDYFSKVFDNCKNQIQNNESLLLNLLYDSEIDSKESIIILTSHYGLPLIEANNLTLMPKTPNTEHRNYIDMANLRGLEMVINRFTFPRYKMSDV